MHDVSYSFFHYAHDIEHLFDSFVAIFGYPSSGSPSSDWQPGLNSAAHLLIVDIKGAEFSKPFVRLDESPSRIIHPKEKILWLFSN